jgi:hypothetical protein
MQQTKACMFKEALPCLQWWGRVFQRLHYFSLPHIDILVHYILSRQESLYKIDKLKVFRSSFTVQFQALDILFFCAAFTFYKMASDLCNAISDP